MLKRILFTLLAILAVYSAVVVGYVIFEPAKAAADDSNLVMLDYDSLRDYTLSTGGNAVHYYFFMDPDDNDCTYVRNTILSDVQNETGLNLENIIEPVDIHPLVQSGQTARLGEDWGISSYPAFAAFHAEGNEIKVENILEWDPQHPFNTDQVVRWLKDNGLYTGEKAQAIISPAA